MARARPHHQQATPWATSTREPACAIPPPPTRPGPRAGRGVPRAADRRVGPGAARRGRRRGGRGRRPRRRAGGGLAALRRAGGTADAGAGAAARPRRRSQRAAVRGLLDDVGSSAVRGAGGRARGGVPRRPGQDGRGWQRDGRRRRRGPSRLLRRPTPATRRYCSALLPGEEHTRPLPISPTYSPHKCRWGLARSYSPRAEGYGRWSAARPEDRVAARSNSNVRATPVCDAAAVSQG